MINEDGIRNMAAELLARFAGASPAIRHIHYAESGGGAVSVCLQSAGLWLRAVKDVSCDAPAAYHASICIGDGTTPNIASDGDTLAEVLQACEAKVSAMLNERIALITAQRDALAAVKIYGALDAEAVDAARATVDAYEDGT